METIKVNLTASNSLAARITKVSHTFNDVRRNVLSYFNENSKGITKQVKPILSQLTLSKKDSELYNLLTTIAPFSYRAIKNKDSFEVVKSFNPTNVLNAAEITLQNYSPQQYEVIETQNKLAAIQVVRDSKNKAAETVETLNKAIESLVNKDSAAAIVLGEKLEKAKQALTNKITFLSIVETF